MAVYFDHNATTPLDPAVRRAMEPWLSGAEGQFGNPSSVHRFGQAARAAVEDARDEVAALLGARPAEIVFTASGTEANNAVIFDAARRGAATGRRHLVMSAFEHASIRQAVARLEEDGFAVSRVAPEPDGVVAPRGFTDALGPGTCLAILMRAQNELGTLQPVAEAAAASRERGVPVLCDAAQAVGKVRVDVDELGVDYLTLGAHKFGGPLGAGALWIRPEAPFDAWLVGGGQERRRRSGTENVAAIVGLGEAARRARTLLEERAAHTQRLRDRLEAGLAAIEGVRLHCAGSPRLPHTAHFAVDGVDGQDLLIRLDLAGYAVSTGSACSSGAVEPSNTLRAMGYEDGEARGSLRVSLGVSNTDEEVAGFLATLRREIEALRSAAASPFLFS